MNKLELKKLLTHQLEIEIELVDLVKELIMECFNDKESAAIAIMQFNDNYERYDDWGCLQNAAFLLKSARESLVKKSERA